MISARRAKHLDSTHVYILSCKHISRPIRARAYVVISCAVVFRACLHGGGGPQMGDVTCGSSPHLSCKRDQIKMRDYVDRCVTHQSGLPHLPWVPHLRVNRPLDFSFFCSYHFSWLDLSSRDATLTSNRIFVHGFCSKFLWLKWSMKNFLRLTSFFFLFCPFTSNLFVNVKLHSGPKEMYRSLLNFFSKNLALIWGRSLKP